jgi:hypothetical protein
MVSKKNLFQIFLIGVLAAISLGALGHFALVSFDRKMDTAVRQLLARYGTTARIELSPVRFAPPNMLHWPGANASGRVSGRGRWQRSWIFSFGSEKVVARLLNPFNGSAELIGETWSLALDPAAASAAEGGGFELGPVRIYLRRLKLPLTVRPASLKAMKRQFMEQAAAAAEIIRSGSSPAPIDLDGKIIFSFEGLPAELNFKTERKEGLTRIKVDENDLKRIGDLTEEGLTGAEVSFLMRHPTDAAQLLMIQRYASLKAAKEHAKDPELPEDAYRHVLWSYLLTQAYGEAFAKELTDAHEAGENKTQDREEDHLMDLSNNAIGREFAKSGFSEGSLTWRTASDPRVIRTAARQRPESPQP